MTNDQMRDPEYLGDGVYVGHDGYQLWLSVNDHEHPTIALDAYVMVALIAYFNRTFNGNGGTK